MILYIDSSLPSQAVVRLGKKEIKFESTQDRKQQILIQIDKIIKDSQLGFKDISTIEVVTGPGSFTGVRIGVAIANAMGLSLDIPVIAIQDGFRLAPAKTVLPYYNKAANVTIQK